MPFNCVTHSNFPKEISADEEIRRIRKRPRIPQTSPNFYQSSTTTTLPSAEELVLSATAAADAK